MSDFREEHERAMRDLKPNSVKQFIPKAISRDEAIQPLRERNMSRVVKGAQAIGEPVDELSLRQRRLLAAITDLPEPWPTARPWRSEGEAMSRHLTALRQRLDWLVRMEDEHGDQQRGVHHNRAERNALIFALQQFAEEAGAEVTRKQSDVKKYDPEYIARRDDEFEEAIGSGFINTRAGEPGVLYHRREDVAPIRVPVSVWFAVRGYARGQEDV